MDKLLHILFLSLILSACSTGKIVKPITPEADDLDTLPGVKTKFQLENQDSKADVLSGESLDRSLISNIDEPARACIIGKFSKGMKIYRQRLSEKATADSWNGLGNCYFRAGKTRVALLNYLKALSINSKHGPSLNNLGVAWLILGDKAKALTHFKKSLRLSKFSKVPRWNLARLYLRHRHFWSANKHFKSLYKLNKSDVSVLEGLAFSSHGKGSLKDAGKYYKKLNKYSNRINSWYLKH